MKKLCLLAALPLVCFCRPGIPENMTWLEEYQLNCGVSSVKVTGNTVEENYLLSFDTYGFPVTKMMFNADGDFQRQELYEFDDSSRLARIDFCETLDAMSSWTEMIYEGGFEVEEVHYGNSGEDLLRVLKENDGKHIVHSRFFREGTFEYETYHEYNDSGLVETMLDSEGRLEGVAVVGFFAPGRISSIKTDELSLRVEYDTLTGLPIRCRGAQVDSRGGVLWSEDGESSERSYEYEFDRFGNWTTRREFSADTLVATIRRKIVY